MKNPTMATWTNPCTKETYFVKDDELGSKFIKYSSEDYSEDIEISDIFDSFKEEYGLIMVDRDNPGQFLNDFSKEFIASGIIENLEPHFWPEPKLDLLELLKVLFTSFKNC